MSSQLSSPPTESPVSTTLCLPQGPPTVSSQVIAHSFQLHQGMPSSPGAPMPPGSSSTPEAAQKHNSCPPPSTSLPQVPWQEAKEPPWLLIHPAASPRSPHPMWGSSAPPCQHPHPGSEVAGCHFQRLHRASHSFPRKQEEDFQGGASGDRSSSPTCYPSNLNPPAPRRLRAAAQGEGGAETGAERGSLLPRKRPIQFCRCSPVPTLLPQPLCSGLERQPHPAASCSVFSALGQQKILLSNPKLTAGPQP